MCQFNRFLAAGGWRLAAILPIILSITTYSKSSRFHQTCISCLIFLVFRQAGWGARNEVEAGKAFA